MPQYQQYAHPSVQDYWRGLPAGEQELLSQHPLFRQHGEELSRGGYNRVHRRSTELQTGPHEGMALYQQIMQHEAQHAEQLEQLAKQAVAQVWGIDPSMLEGELTQDVSVPAGERPQAAEMSPAVRQQINKRLTLNSLSHGAAVHQMQTLHYVVADALQRIDPELVDLYSKLSSAATQMHWMVDVGQFVAQMAGQAQSGGSEEVQFDQQGNPKVVAKAICFPILAQELSKGVMELLTMHGLSDLDEQTAQAVIESADDPRQDIWLTQAGQELWRKFLAALPQGTNMAEVVAALSKQSPEEVQRIMEAIVNNPQAAGGYLRQLAASRRLAHTGATIDRFLTRAQVTAPVAPPQRRTSPAPMTQPPLTEPARPDPFRPTQPKVMPKPKARKK